MNEWKTPVKNLFHSILIGFDMKQKYTFVGFDIDMLQLSLGMIEQLSTEMGLGHRGK